MKKILIFVFSFIIFSGIFVSSITNVAYAVDSKLYSINITPTSATLSTADFLPNTEITFTLHSSSDNFNEPTETIFSNSVGTAVISFSNLSKNTRYLVTADSRDDSVGFSFTTPDLLVKESGICGSSNGRTLKDKPTTNLCSSGTPSLVSETADEWSWWCSGFNGGASSSTCFTTKAGQEQGDSYYDFICKATVDARSESVIVKIDTRTNPNLWKIGVLDTKIPTSTGTPNFNNVLDVKTGYFLTTYDFSQLERGINYRTLVYSKGASKFAVELPNCSFKIPAIVDGVCGSAKGKTFSSKPTSNLCASGKAGVVSQNYKEWQWSCSGENGGKSSQTCIANVGGSTTTTTTTNTDEAIDASSEGGGLVPDCPPDGCGFNELMILINNVIKFLLFTIATPLAALIFVYAGFKLLTSGGSAESMTTAKKILKNLIIGYVIALAAWLVINTILTSEFLGYKGPTFLQDN